MQRLRLKFSRGDGLKYLSHLDLMRLWERTFRRAGLKIAYSEGFSPHPRISLAAPLVVGITSSAELMDVFLVKPASTQEFLKCVRLQLPDGIAILEISAVPPDSPSLQSRVRHAEYKLTMAAGNSEERIRASISSLLQSGSLPWHHARDTGERFYDLRPLIDDIWFVESGERSSIIGMRLRCDPSGSGRPEQVARALGFEDVPVSIERTRLILA